MANYLHLAIDLFSLSFDELLTQIESEAVLNPLILFDNEMCFLSRSQKVDLDDIVDNKNNDLKYMLKNQVVLGEFNSIEREIAGFLIDNLDEYGFSENYYKYREMVSFNLNVYIEWIEVVRKKIMFLEPIGCGAIDIKESIEFQVKNKCEKILPRPGMSLSGNNYFYINPVPEINFNINKNKIFVENINRLSQEIFIDKKLLVKLNEKNNFVRESLIGAKNLIKSLYLREHSLLKVSLEIVKFQCEFLMGKGPLRPLRLKDISRTLGLHQSTISRIIRNKYCKTIYGIHKFRYFFSGKIICKNSSFCSSVFVKNQIKFIIKKEDKKYPLSDQKIKERLEESLGVKIARRTVAKYRRILQIMPARFRKINAYSCYQLS